MPSCFPAAVRALPIKLECSWRSANGSPAQTDVSRFGVLGTDSDFWRVNFDVRRYVPIANRHTLAFFSLATFTSGTLGEDFATWQAFSIGGTNPA